jgi:hypothetical protein
MGVGLSPRLPYEARLLGGSAMPSLKLVLGNPRRRLRVSGFGEFCAETMLDIQREALRQNLPVAPSINPLLVMAGVIGCAGFIIVLPFITAAIASLVVG